MPSGFCWLGLFCLVCIVGGALVAVKVFGGQFLEASYLAVASVGMIGAMVGFMRTWGRRLAVLEAERERLRLLFERSPDAHLLFDATGIIDCNVVALQILGFQDRTELLGIHPAALSPEFQPDGRRSLEKCLEMDAVARQQGAHRFEWMHRKRDGTEFPVEVNITCVELNGTEAFVVVWHDLTERRAAEAALQQSHARMSLLFEELCYSEARFHAFLDQGPLLTWITDATGRIAYLNEPYCTMIGRKLEECIGKTAFDLFPADTAQALLENIEMVAQTGQPLTAEESARLADGTLRHFLVHKFLIHDLEGRPLVGGSAIDITERKETELALLHSQKQLKLAQKVARMGSWEYDVRTGKISWSPEMFVLLGLDPAKEEPDYADNLALYHPRDAQRLNNCVQKAIAEGKEYALDLQRAPLGPLASRWYHGVGTVERDASGNIIRLVGTLTDITERKAIEEAIKQSQENLKHAQAMAHVGSWERDYLTGTMSWSDEMYRLCGLEPGTILPSIEALTTFTHPLDRKRAHDCMLQAIHQGRDVEVEVRLVGADGVLRYVSIRTEILKNEAGQPIGSRGTLADVTERVKALQQQTKFVHLIENSSDFIAMATLDGMLLSMNPAGRKLVGLERVEEVSTTMLQDFIPAEVWEEIRREVLPAVMRDDRWEGESQLMDVVTGKNHDMQASFFLIRNPISGEPMCLATVQRDITTQKWLDTQLQQILVLVQDQNVELELQRQELAVANMDLETANARLEALATTDGLTGAKNHRAFQERLTEEYRRADRTCRTFSLILLDVDRFKHYNDEFGHPEGDRVLKQIVQLLHDTARVTDVVARYGGEEFVVLLPETGMEGAIEAAERFRQAIEGAEWPYCPMTASFGVASLTPITESGQQLVEMADRALYASKANGRNCVTHAAQILQAVV